MGTSLDLQISQISPKSLTRSQSRAAKISAFHKAAFLGQTLPLLRRLEGKVFRAAMQAEPPVMPKLVDSLVKLIEQRRILLRIPSPGRDTPSEAKTIELPSAAAIDVQEIERLARDAEQVVSETVSEQPASDSGSVSSTDQPS